MFSPLEGNLRGHYIMFSPLEGNLRGNCIMFSRFQRYLTSTLSLLGRITFTPLEGRP